MFFVNVKFLNYLNFPTKKQDNKLGTPLPSELKNESKAIDNKPRLEL